MKVIILTGEPFPHGMAAVSRIKCYAAAIAEGGAECEILIYRRTEVCGRAPKNTEGNGFSGKVPFRYIGGTPLRGSNVFVRQLDDFLDVRRTVNYLKQTLSEGDVLFLYMGDYTGVTVRFIKAAHSRGAVCVRDQCELPYATGPETAFSAVKRAWSQRQLFPLLDGVVSISDALLDYAKKYTKSSCRHIKVPILVDFEKFAIVDQASSETVPFMFHAGTLYEQKDGFLGMLEAFGKAAARLNFPVRFISTGNPEDGKITELISKYGIEDKVFFTGYITEEELRDYVSRAAFTVINKHRTLQNRYCFSTKLGEYLAAAKPVVMTNVGEAMNWVKDGQSAYVVEPDDVEALSDRIANAFLHPEDAAEIGLAGKDLCRRSFDYRSWAGPLVHYFKELSNGRKR